MFRSELMKTVLGDIRKDTPIFLPVYNAIEP